MYSLDLMNTEYPTFTEPHFVSTSYSMMTWRSAQAIFRRCQLPLYVQLIVAALGLTASSSYSGLSVPVVTSWEDVVDGALAPRNAGRAPDAPVPNVVANQTIATVAQKRSVTLVERSRKDILKFGCRSRD